MPNNIIQPIPIAPIVDGRPTAPVWVNWFNSVFRLLRGAPFVYTGILAPSTTPEKIGDLFVNTASGKAYISVGTSSSSDWKILN